MYTYVNYYHLFRAVTVQQSIVHFFDRASYRNLLHPHYNHYATVYLNHKCDRLNLHHVVEDIKRLFFHLHNLTNYHHDFATYTVDTED